MGRWTTPRDIFVLQGEVIGPGYSGKNISLFREYILLKKALQNETQK